MHLWLPFSETAMCVLLSGGIGLHYCISVIYILFALGLTLCMPQRAVSVLVCSARRVRGFNFIWYIYTRGVYVIARPADHAFRLGARH